MMLKLKNTQRSPKSRYQVWGTGWLILITSITLAFFFFLPGIIDQHMNNVYTPRSEQLDQATKKLHEQLVIADLHADTLLWNRDPSRRGQYGHVDLPRMLEANMGMQVFSAVTKTPRGLNFEQNEGTTDNITPLVIAQRWPLRTWNNLTERALYQAQRLQRLATNSQGRFVVLQSKSDLARFKERKDSGSKITSGLLAIEGMHALEGISESLDRLHQAGFRMMGLTHFFDNAVGGSAHGVTKGGLTKFGRNMVAEMERLRIVIDLAHASPQLITDVLKIAKRPVVVSHTGVKGTCPRTRNLSDSQLQLIAKNGGLVGISFFEEATCGNDVTSIVHAIQYTADLIGIKHVALGSDFDGAVTTPFDITGLPSLTGALMNYGFSSADIKAIMGGNVIDLLTNALPEKP